jgi:hypothetical protein
MGTGVIRAVPEWVTRSRLIVSATEDFLLWLFGETGSPDVLGSRLALAWIGGLDDTTSPMVHAAAPPTKRRAIAEFMIAEAISQGEPYPGAGWFAERHLPVTEVPPAEFWQVHAGYAGTRSYALGVATAVGWAFGVIEDVATMTPVHWEDGAELSDGDRQVCAAALRALSTRPTQPHPRPQLSRRRPVGAADSWIA